MCCSSKVHRLMYFLTFSSLIRAGLEIWNTIYDAHWPSSLYTMAKITTYISCFVSCFNLILCIVGCWSVSGQFKGVSRFLWWCMYLGTTIDILNNIAFLSMIGFGMNPFITTCAFGADDVPATCADHACIPWEKCTRVWHLTMIWVAATIVSSFILNSLAIYCFHVSCKSEPAYRGGAYQAPPPMMYQRPLPPLQGKSYAGSNLSYEYNRPPLSAAPSRSFSLGPHRY
ncbi:hypothetical protein BC940DRAFT_343299 [Gongronella butleri]|nr:hypothetical protein BC940DRAFT_343299 [Gongronella butleri]